MRRLEASAKGLSVERSEPHFLPYRNVLVLGFPNFSSAREALPVSQYASELWICVTMATSSHCAPNQASRCECSTIKTSKIYNQDPQALQSKPPSSTIKPSNKQPHAALQLKCQQSHWLFQIVNQSNNIIVNYLIVKSYNNSQNKHYALYTRLPL